MNKRSFLAAVAAFTLAVVATTSAQAQFSLSLTGVVSAWSGDGSQFTNLFPLGSAIGISLSVNPSLSSADQNPSSTGGDYYSNITAIAVHHASYNYSTNSPTGLAVSYPYAMFTKVANDSGGFSDFIQFTVGKSNGLDSVIFNNNYVLGGIGLFLNDTTKSVFTNDSMPSSINPALFDSRSVILSFQHKDTGAPAGSVSGTLAAVPEPSSILLVGLGLGACGWLARRRRRQ